MIHRFLIKCVVLALIAILKYHKLGGLSTTEFISHGSGSLKLLCQHDSILLRALYRLWMAEFSLYLPMVEKYLMSL